MKKSIVEKLGLEARTKLTKKECLARRKYLKKAIEKKKFKGELLDIARYYSSRYGWLAKNGGKNKKVA